MRTAVCVLAALLGWSAFASANDRPPLAAVTLVGPPVIVFASTRDACDGHDVPDTPARAYRDEKGQVVLFAMHYENRALRGENLLALKLDCRVVLGSGGRAEPEAYDDRSWITATWTEDGRSVAALVHHEYQAHTHPGRCRHKAYLACWHNTVLAVTSRDGGSSFTRPKVPQVVASTPFGQEAEQGRHRGFFNPSNIFAVSGVAHAFIATTGWRGQPSGACLFRSATPADPGSWRAFDGEAFSIRYADPYRAGRLAPPAACRPIAPFPAPVGAVVRHRGSEAFLAVYQASADAKAHPKPGFYTTSSRDLLTWDAPRLLLEGRTLYDDPCGSERLIAYPSLMDPDAAGRNFDDVGDAAELFFSTLRVEGCRITSDRDLVRRRVAIRVFP